MPELWLPSPGCVVAGCAAVFLGYVVDLFIGCAFWLPAVECAHDPMVLWYRFELTVLLRRFLQMEMTSFFATQKVAIREIPIERGFARALSACIPRGKN